ncbi:MAG TPA: hypothetical protein VFM79_12510 [Pelobium sp.]|nr:hypothetical protein [Pelobium sp.]
MFQNISPISDTTARDLSAFAENKKIPKIIEESVLIALSYYPELIDTEIDFVFKKNIKKSVMQAQPKFSTLLRSKENRAFQINISAMFKLTNSATPIHQLPKNIMIGWIGHELGHVMDYKTRSLFSLLGFGAGYLFSERYVQKAERVADTFAVNHGLGFYIIETKRFILDQSDLPEKYKEKISRLYLSPDDIVEQVRKIEEAKKAKNLKRKAER